MQKSKRTPAADALTNLILELFRVNNGLLTAGDRLVAPLGLTSARWQILGAIVEAARPQPVAWLARDLGVSRQNVQRIVNDLNKGGLVALERNPHHRRAPLVVLTEKGRHMFEGAMRVQIPWVEDLADRLSIKDLDTAHRVLKILRERLDGSDESEARG